MVKTPPTNQNKYLYTPSFPSFALGTFPVSDERESLSLKMESYKTNIAVFIF
jgi:hypothetical protein